MSKKILIIDGSLGGIKGNSQELVKKNIEELKKYEAVIEVIHLKEHSKLSHEWLKEKLQWADGFIFNSGTYWDSWGSPMQNFLESITDFEGTPLLLGKPASVLITMHSVGGKEVLSRLQGVLNTMGLAIPPMSGMVYSLATHLALNDKTLDFGADFWSMDDSEIIVHNFMTYLHGKNNYQAWPVDRKDPKRKWLSPT
jgi:multimeric flavodoxin WrbA